MHPARFAANALLYGGIAALSFAQSWSDDHPLTWKFWVGIALAFAVAVKALMSKGVDSSEPTVNVEHADRVGPNTGQNAPQG